MKTFFQTGVSAVLTVITYLVGDFDLPLIALAIFMLMDFITGIIIAILNHELSSSVGAKGLAKKSLIIAILIMAVMLDRLINSGEWIFRTLVCYFYIANEGISVIENSAELGLPVPKRLKDVLVQLKEKEQDEPQ